ncbi:hypothetical protein [Photobacterium leiognathi]|uniref:hypothetical protein n=1 Tax=Photobacterium leiognathi TaxID=553611 RepID=UPI002982154E|nr:hypothetical protein [Photobacterium leiognathi]
MAVKKINSIIKPGTGEENKIKHDLETSLLEKELQTMESSEIDALDKTLSGMDIDGVMSVASSLFTEPNIRFSSFEKLLNITECTEVLKKSLIDFYQSGRVEKLDLNSDSSITIGTLFDEYEVSFKNESEDKFIFNNALNEFQINQLRIKASDVSAFSLMGWEAGDKRCEEEVCHGVYKLLTMADKLSMSIQDGSVRRSFDYSDNNLMIEKITLFKSCYFEVLGEQNTGDDYEIIIKSSVKPAYRDIMLDRGLISKETLTDFEYSIYIGKDSYDIDKIYTAIENINIHRTQILESGSSSRLQDMMIKKAKTSSKDIKNENSSVVNISNYKH